MKRGTSKDSNGISFNTTQSIRRSTSHADVWTRDPHKVPKPKFPKEKEETKDTTNHHREYKTKMKWYVDQTSRAKHNFEVGDVVYIASMENGKLNSTIRDTRCVLLRNTANNSFEPVNTEDGSKVIRNVKHLQHTPVVMDFDVSEPAEAQMDTGALDMQCAQSTPADEIPPEPDSAPVPEKQVTTTKSGRVIRKQYVTETLKSY